MTDIELFVIGLLILVVVVLAAVSGMKVRHQRVDEGRADARQAADLVHRRQAYLAAGLPSGTRSKVDLPKLDLRSLDEVTAPK